MLFENDFDEDAAVEKLKELGYRVIKQELPKDAVDPATDVGLLQHFYGRRLFYNADRKFPPSLNYKEDIKYISGFIAQRQKLGLGRKFAIKEAAVLIDALFKFEEHLRLKEPIVGPNILMVTSIMNRICTFANGEVGEVGESENVAYVTEINDIYKKKFAERDSLIAAKSRKRILERIHEQGSGNTEGSTDSD